jgi:cyclophilin family peptidyl-prolyl cis-trans isomerase
MSDANRTAMRSAGIVVLLAAAAGFIGLGLRDASPSDRPAETIPPVDTAVVTAPPVAVDPTTTLASGPLPCPATDGSQARVNTFTVAPPMCLTAGSEYTAALNTSEGTILVGLDAAGAPNAVNSFVYLARYRFYDGLKFHIVVPEYIIQTGSPDSSEAGGPGYTISAERGSRTLDVGDVALSGAGPGTNGSQFFVLTGNLAPVSSADFTQIGRVRNGLDVVQKIDALGVDPSADGAAAAPTREITIDSIEIREEAAPPPEETTTTVEVPA